jgi:hypothetical protein
MLFFSKVMAQVEIDLVEPPCEERGVARHSRWTGRKPYPTSLCQATKPTVCEEMTLEN